MTVMTTMSRPYDAKHVIYQDRGSSVLALWTPDAKATAKTISVHDEAVRVIGAARRFRKYEGSDFSGWIVERGRSEHSDPIANKREAIRQLHMVIDEYFRSEVEADEMSERVKLWRSTAELDARAGTPVGNALRAAADEVERLHAELARQRADRA